MTPQELLQAGQAALNNGDFADAFSRFQELARLHPQSADVWRGCAASLYGLSDFRRALAAAEEAVRLAPNAPGGFMVLGPPAFVLSSETNVDACKRLIERLSREDGETIAKFWSQRLSEKDYFIAAAAAYSIFAKAHPDYAEAALELGHLYLNASQPDECEKVLDLAESKFGLTARIAAMRARIYVTRGDTEAAKNAALTAIHMNSGVIPAYVVLSETAPELIDVEMDRRLADALSDAGLPLDARAVGLMARGRAQEKRREFDQAFESFSASKSISKEMSSSVGQRYDRAATEKHARLTIARYSAFAPRDLEPTAAPSVVFIIGMPRSGSTLIDQVLSRHSKTSSIGESMNVANISRWVAQNSEQGARLSNGLLAQGRGHYRDRYQRAANGASHVIDKNLFNFEHCGLIADLDPNARFIMTEREPEDIALSIFKTKFLSALPWTNELEDIAHMQATYEFFAEHWRRVIADRIHVVSHEEFVADFEHGVRALLDFCGLDFDAQCLEFHKGDRQVFTTSAAQVRRPLNAEGVGRWRQYEKRLTSYVTSLGEFRRRYAERSVGKQT